MTPRCLNYKISWTFEGVLNSYYRPAKLVMDGQVVSVNPDDIFHEKWKRVVDVGEFGKLEGFPNGDVARYVQLARLDTVRNAGRFEARY